MGNLTVTGLDEAVLAKLSRRAAEHGRTLEAEAADILAQKLAASSQPGPEGDVWDEMDASRQQTGRLDVRTIDLLREDRDGRCD